MSKRQILVIIGVWVILLPFLGLPGTWKTILMACTGVVLCFLAYSGQSRQSKSESSFSNSYSDNLEAHDINGHANPSHGNSMGNS